MRNIALRCVFYNKPFLRASTENNLFAKVTGKRKREIGLVVPARFSAVSTEFMRIAEVLEREN